MVQNSFTRGGRTTRFETNTMIRDTNAAEIRVRWRFAVRSRWSFGRRGSDAVVLRGVIWRGCRTICQGSGGRRELTTGMGSISIPFQATTIRYGWILTGVSDLRKLNATDRPPWLLRYGWMIRRFRLRIDQSEGEIRLRLGRRA